MATPDPREGESPAETVLQRAETAKRVWEVATWIIEAGVIVVGFISDVGGLVQFLMEVGFFGFACYVAAFIFVPLTVAGLEALERGTNRQTTDIGGGILVGAALLGGGALVRFGVFAPGFTEDLDAIGSTFLALLGLAVLLVPIAVWWYFRGSRPRA